MKKNRIFLSLLMIAVLLFLASCRTIVEEEDRDVHDMSSWGIYQMLGSDGLYKENAEFTSPPTTPSVPEVYYDSSEYVPSHYESYTDTEDSEPTVYITDTGTKYHTASCGSLWNSCHATTPSEAWDMGYTPCKRCNPPLSDELEEYIKENY